MDCQSRPYIEVTPGDTVTGSLSPEAPPFVSSSVHRMNMVPVQRPTLYDGETPWIQYEMMAEINGWDESEKASFLVTSLAMGVLQTLPAEDHHSYQRLERALNARFRDNRKGEMAKVALQDRTRRACWG